MPTKSISIRIEDSQIKQIEEIQKYYKDLMGVDLNQSGIIRMAIFNLYAATMGEED